MLREKTAIAWDKYTVAWHDTNFKCSDSVRKFNAKVASLCYTDIQLFTLIFLKHYLKYPHNSFHCESFDLLESSVQKLAIAAARGLAKSSVYTLAGVLHDILYQKEKYILILSNTTPQALIHSKNIIYELTDNDRIINVFGDVLPGRKTSCEDFVTKTGIKVSARGAGSSIRGIRHGAHRPSKVILDDVEDDETVANTVTREKFEEWFLNVVTFVGDSKTKYYIDGTILHEESLLSRLQKNPSYLAKTYPMILSWDTAPDLWGKWRAIYNNKDSETHLKDAEDFFCSNKDKMLAGTRVAWPERDSYLDLQKKIVEIGMPSFMQEYQMDAVDLSKVLFSDFHYFTLGYHENQHGIFTHNGKFLALSGFDAYVAIDPTSGSKNQASGDDTSIIVAYVESAAKPEDRRVFVYKDWTRNAKPTEWLAKLLHIAEENNCIRIIIEENLYRNFLVETIQDARKKMPFNGHSPSKLQLVLNNTNKEKRIMQIEPKINNGKIQFIKEGLSQQFWGQLRHYRPDGKCKDDVPDCIEMLWSAARKFTSGTATVALP